MFKNFLIIFFLIFLTNCSHPGTALLGPAFTGVTTKSLGQTSLSYGTNQIIKKVQETSKKTKKEVKKEVKKIVKKIENFDLETKSKNFYASVTNLYLQDQLQKKESFLFHR
jgi:hypothetical protein